MDPPPIPGHMNSHVQPTLRLPRLSYRIKSSDSESIKTTSTDTSRTTTSTNATSPSQSTFCPSPREPPADCIRPTSIRSPSIVSSAVVSRPPNDPPKHPLKNPPKKRPGFLSGLFSAKEPSAQAFAEYEKRLLKQGSGRANTLVAGVSSAKLPPTVPRVNSKWDGVPDSLKEREKLKQDVTQSTSGRGRRPSSTRTAGTDSRSLSRGTLGGMSTHNSSSGSNKLADLYGWEVNCPVSSSSSAVLDFATEHRPTTARLQTSHSAPAPLERRPPLDRNSLFPPHVPSQYPTCPQLQSEQSSLGIHGSSDVPSYSNSPALTPFESLPVTPNAFTPTMNLESPRSENGEPDDLKTTILEAPASFNKVVVRSAGVNILGPPATAKWRAKASPCGLMHDHPKTPGSDIPLNSVLKTQSAKTTPPPVRTGSYFPHTGPAPPAASVRPDPARDRPGLGMSVTNHAVAPWSLPNDDAEAETRRERNITPTPDGGRSMRKKSRMFNFKS